MKKCIFTFIFGEYDSLKEPEVVTPGWDYICFTDQNFKSDVWNINQIHLQGPSKLIARFVNLMPHKLMWEYDLSISIGGQIGIQCNLDDFLKKNYNGEVMMLRKHPDRKCTYEEGSACIRLNKDDPKTIIDQMQSYLQEGLPKNSGMIETGVIIRKHNDPDMIKHAEYWWAEISTKSHRDQLSFNYVLWKYGLIDPGYYKYDILKSDFKLNKHDRRNKSLRRAEQR